MRLELKKNDGRRYVSRKLSFRAKRFLLVRDRIRVNGGIHIRDWIYHPAVAAILALDAKKRILMVGQHRYGVNRYEWEIPAGTADPGESPRACAVRECAEEAGFCPRKVKSLGVMVPSPAGSNEVVHLFFSDDIIPVPTNPDPDEKIDAKFFAQSGVRRMLASGKIRDAKTIVALYRYFATVD